MKSLVHTEEVCSRSVPLEQNLSCVSAFTVNKHLQSPSVLSKSDQRVLRVQNFYVHGTKTRKLLSQLEDRIQKKYFVIVMNISLSPLL